MDWLATLRRSGGIESLARQLRMPTATTLADVETLLPPLIEGLKDYVRAHGGSDAGIKALLAAIDAQGDGDLAIAVMGPAPLAPDAGQLLLQQIFGDERGSAVSIKQATTDEGSDRQGTLFPVLAMLVCGYIAARANVGGKADPAAWLREALAIGEDERPERGIGPAA